MHIRDHRQKKVYEWCVAAFGETNVKPAQRALRFLEEAIELTQACKVPKDFVDRLVTYVYGRPEGDLLQELGGAGITLLALAESLGVSAEEAEALELGRVLSKPLDYYTRRNENKDSLGFKIGA